MNGSNMLSGQLGTFEAYEDLPADEDWPVDATTGLVSMAFVKGAIRRSAVFCWIMTIAGFLVGCAIYVEFPAPVKASTSIFLTYGPYEGGNGAQFDEQAIVETRAVAALAMHKLGLQGDPGGFLSSYTATPISQRILSITFSASSPAQALNGASAVAAAFLQFRASELERAQSVVIASLTQQVNQTKQKVSSIKAQVSKVSAQPASSAQQSQLSALRSQLGNATATLTNLEQSLSDTEAADQPATTTAVKDSQVLDSPTLIASSHLRTVLLYPGASFVAGIALGFGIVVIRAIVSDRLRRRDDVAGALGVPVKLSTGSLRPLKWWQLASRRSSAARQAAVRRVAAYLASVLPRKTRGTAALAVVAVDDPEAAAAPLASLATTYAQEGRRVVVADLASGAPAARLLGGGEPGVNPVDVQNCPVVVAVPERDEVAAVGPLGHSARRGQRSDFTDAVASACTRADVLLTLVTLDPALGGEHLATWAPDAVAVVTAGMSTWTKINAAGEMIRLSGTRLVSAVLIGADKTDETLGLAPPELGLDAEAVLRGTSSNQKLPSWRSRDPVPPGEGGQWTASSLGARPGEMTSGSAWSSRTGLTVSPPPAQCSRRRVQREFIEQSVMRGGTVEVTMTSPGGEGRNSRLRPGVLLDRDGTIIVDHGYVGSVDRVEFIDGAAEAIARFNQAGIPVAVVTNQAGVARGLYGIDDVAEVHAYITEQLAKHGARIDLFLFSPYHPDGIVQAFARTSDDRKPGPGMANAAAAALSLDLATSWVVGDRPEDLGLAEAIGASAVYLGTDGRAGPGVYPFPSLAVAAPFILERITA